MIKLSKLLFFILLCGMFLMGSKVNAAIYTTVALPEVNTNISTWTMGGEYNAIFPSTQTYNGVPFNLVKDANGNKVFYEGTLEIPVNVYGVTNAYTLAASYCGYYGTTIGKVEFFGSGDGYYSVDLVEGNNIRDHYWGGYNNIIDGVTAVAAFNKSPGHAGFDMQLYDLPNTFLDETLLNVVFTGYNMGTAGKPWLAALTVETSPVVTPVPATLWLLGFGLAGLVGIRKKLKQ